MEKGVSIIYFKLLYNTITLLYIDFLNGFHSNTEKYKHCLYAMTKLALIVYAIRLRHVYNIIIYVETESCTWPLMLN